MREVLRGRHNRRMQFTDEDLAQTGEPDLETLRRRAAHAGPIDDDTPLYCVQFHVVR